MGVYRRILCALLIRGRCERPAYANFCTEKQEKSEVSHVILVYDKHELNDWIIHGTEDVNIKFR
jgi:hypothetical protein